WNRVAPASSGDIARRRPHVFRFCRQFARGEHFFHDDILRRSERALRSARADSVLLVPIATLALAQLLLLANCRAWQSEKCSPTFHRRNTVGNWGDCANTWRGAAWAQFDAAGSTRGSKYRRSPLVARGRPLGCSDCRDQPRCITGIFGGNLSHQIT